VVKLLNKRWRIPIDARPEGPKLEPEGPRAEVGSRPPTRGFQAFKAWTNANDKMTVKDYIFLQNIMHREKYSNINCAKWWIPTNRCRISILWGRGSVIRGSGSQTKGAGSEIRWDPIPLI